MAHELLHIDRELAGTYNQTVIHDSLVKMHVRAFSWEVNRNDFQIKRAPLELAHINAFGEEVAAYRSFEGTPCNRKHLMVDNGNSNTDQVIGYIERADLQDDGVYLDIILWKRCLSDEELRQIREFEVEVSMEVDYTDPVNIVNGVETPAIKGSRRLPGVVRSMADHSVVNFQGLGILFDGVRPGFASSEVLAAENAAEDQSSEKTNEVEQLSTEDAELSVEPGVTMTEQEIAELKEQLAAATERATAAEATISSKQAELDAKYDELNKLSAELSAIRKAAWDAAIAANFDLGKIGASTIEWLLEYLRWNTWALEDIPGFAARFAEIGAAVKIVVTETAEEVVSASEDVVSEEAAVTEPETTPEVTPVVETETAAAATPEIAKSPETVNIASSPAPAKRRNELDLL